MSTIISLQEKESWGAIGSGFAHTTSTTLHNVPKKINWVHGKVLPTTFFFDNCITDGLYKDCDNKFAWLLESNCIIPRAIEFVKNNVELVSKSYKYLFSHNKEITALADNFIFTPSHCTWIKEPNIYAKSKLVSMISSNKGWTNGHKHRLGLVEKFRNKVDLYGRGFNEIAEKEDALCDYMFSIVVENDSYPGYFSEKILDAFATCTIPIYYGDPTIGEHFNEKGIIKLDDNFDINSLSEDLYIEMFNDALINLLNVIDMGETVEDKVFDFLNSK